MYVLQTLKELHNVCMVIPLPFQVLLLYPIMNSQEESPHDDVSPESDEGQTFISEQGTRKNGICFNMCTNMRLHPT